MAITSIDARQYTELFDYDANGRVLYLGWAAPGSDNKQENAIWKIAKFFYKTTAMGTQASAMVWANGNTNLDNKWSERTSLTYK